MDFDFIFSNDGKGMVFDDDDDAAGSTKVIHDSSVSRMSRVELGRRSSSLLPLLSMEINFSEVCSCHECSPKISELMDFLAEIQSFVRPIQERIEELDKPREMSLLAFDFFRWMGDVFFLLQRRHEEVVGPLGERFSQNTMYDAYLRLEKKLVEVGFQEPWDGVEGFEAFFRSQRIVDGSYYTVAYRIKEGIKRSENAGCGVEARPVLEKILAIENEYQEDKNSAGACVSPAPGDRIKLQMEELMNLSRILELRVHQLIADAESVTHHIDLLSKAFNWIDSTEYNIRQKRVMLRAQPQDMRRVKGHDLIKDALDGLLSKRVQRFNNQLKAEWTSLLTIPLERKLEG